MLSIESIRKLDPANTEKLTDEQLESLRAHFYALGNLIFDDWQEGSKNPVRLSETKESNSTL